VRKNNEKEKRLFLETVKVIVAVVVAAGVEVRLAEPVEAGLTPTIPETITPHGVIPPVINPTPLLTGIITITLNTVNVPVTLHPILSSRMNNPPKVVVLLNPHLKDPKPFPLKNPNHPLINPNLTFQNPIKEIQMKNPLKRPLLEERETDIIIKVDEEVAAAVEKAEN
jgi:hypothetical protein